MTTLWAVLASSLVFALIFLFDHYEKAQRATKAEALRNRACADARAQTTSELRERLEDSARAASHLPAARDGSRAQERVMDRRLDWMNASHRATIDELCERVTNLTDEGLAEFIAEAPPDGRWLALLREVQGKRRPSA